MVQNVSKYICTRNEYALIWLELFTNFIETLFICSWILLTNRFGSLSEGIRVLFIFGAPLFHKCTSKMSVVDLHRAVKLFSPQTDFNDSYVQVLMGYGSLHLKPIKILRPPQLCFRKMYTTFWKFLKFFWYGALVEQNFSNLGFEMLKSTLTCNLWFNIFEIGWGIRNK